MNLKYRVNGTKSTDFDLSDDVHIMIMIFSGGGGILSFIAPVLKLVEAYAFNCNLMLVIQSYILMFR